MEIKLLLEKYKNLGFSQKKIKERALLVFKNFSLTLTDEEIQIKDTEIKIKVSGVKRAHFVLYKQKIENSLQEELKKEGLIVTKIF